MILGPNGQPVKTISREPIGLSAEVLEKVNAVSAAQRVAWAVTCAGLQSHVLLQAVKLLGTPGALSTLEQIDEGDRFVDEKAREAGRYANFALDTMTETVDGGFWGRAAARAVGREKTLQATIGKLAAYAVELRKQSQADIETSIEVLGDVADRIELIISGLSPETVL